MQAQCAQNVTIFTPDFHSQQPAHLLFLCSSVVNATLALVDIRFQDRSKCVSEVEPRT